MKRNRWGMAVAAVGIHISIGSVYAWSVLTGPVMTALEADIAAVQWTFSLAILFLGMSAAFLGPTVERLGPRRSGLLSTLCFTAGLWGAAWAVDSGSLAALYLAYGCIGGIGLGVGYITPVATLMKWFPRHRGFATGLAVMGFGFAALVAGPVMQQLTAAFGVGRMFGIVGAAYAVVMGLSSLYLAPPPERAVAADAPVRPAPDHSLTAAQALRTPTFYLIWTIFFINITCGIGMLSIAAPLARESVGMTAADAAAFVGLLGLVNGAGRLAWASISDVIGRAATYLIFFGWQTVAYSRLAGAANEWEFYLWMAGIISCYGGGFAVLPAFLAERFGLRYLSNIHGKMLTAWAAAGIAGPLLLSTVRSATAGFGAALHVFTALSLAALVLTAVIRRWPPHRAD